MLYMALTDYQKEYYKRPEVKAHRKKYYRLYMKARRQKPEEKAKLLEYNKSPSVKQYHKKYNKNYQQKGKANYSQRLYTEDIKRMNDYKKEIERRLNRKVSFAEIMHERILFYLKY